jgi:RNA-binding protein
MVPLTSAQRKYLRKMAHDLKPVAFIGKQGLTEAVVAAVREVLEAHELIKVKLLEHTDEKQEIAEFLATETASALVAIIGHVAILYREQPNPEKRTILLP